MVCFGGKGDHQPKSKSFCSHQPPHQQTVPGTGLSWPADCTTISSNGSVHGKGRVGRFPSLGTALLEPTHQVSELLPVLFIDLFLHIVHSRLLLTPHTSPFSQHALIGVARQVRKGGLYIADGIYKSSFIPYQKEQDGLRKISQIIPCSLVYVLLSKAKGSKIIRGNQQYQQSPPKLRISSACRVAGLK